jgi:hypothetical protein
MARDSVSIPIEPTIAPPKDPIETWQPEHGVERPSPPDSPCHIEVCVGTRFQFSDAGQYLYVVQQILLRDLQAAVGKSRPQVFQRKAAPFNYPPARSEPTKSRTRTFRRRVSIPREGQQVPIRGRAVSLNSSTREDGHGRTVCYKRAVRPSLKNCC